MGSRRAAAPGDGRRTVVVDLSGTACAWGRFAAETRRNFRNTENAETGRKTYNNDNTDPLINRALLQKLHKFLVRPPPACARARVQHGVPGGGEMTRLFTAGESLPADSLRVLSGVPVFLGGSPEPVTAQTWTAIPSAVRWQMPPESPPAGTMAFAVDATGTGSCRLWSVADGQAVAGSTITIAAGSPRPASAEALTLAAGATVEVQYFGHADRARRVRAPVVHVRLSPCLRRRSRASSGGGRDSAP